jgi:predicted metalloprotease
MLLEAAVRDWERAMNWRGLRRSGNVEDERGAGGGRIGVGRGGVGLLVLAVVVYFIGGPQAVMQLLGTQDVTQSVDQGTGSAAPGQPDENLDFVKSVLGSTEDVWTGVLAAKGIQYLPPHLTLFDHVTDSACGDATSATGPFYCPSDQKVYLDLSFFRELAQMGGPGEFAQAYVIGHEVGHHVQNLLGISDKVRQAQSRASERDVNRLSVLLELQADCYAGVWANRANRTNKILEPGDVDEGLAAAAAIGDDRLQRNAGRRVAPETFTHGSSALRTKWLQTGLTTGNIDACDTFAGA